MALLVAHAAAFAQPEPPSSEDPARDSAQKIQQALRDASEAIQHGQGDEALDDLGAVDAIEPNNPWAWYFRGQAHRLLGDPYRAMEAYDSALDELATLGNPEPELFERIKAERHAARRRVFNLSLQTGVAYDSNVSFSGTGATVDFVSGRGDGEFATLMQLDYVPYVTNEQAVTVGARFNQVLHFSIKEFDYQDYGGYIRFTQRLNDSWTFDLRYDYDLYYLDHESFSSINTITPRFNFRWPTRDVSVSLDETSLFYRIEALDYLYPTTSRLDRDGYVNAVGIEQTLRIRPVASNPAWVWDAFAGYQFQYVSTEGSEFDYYGNDVYFGLSVPMKNSWLDDKILTARFLAGVEFDNYRNPSGFDRRGRERDDVITTIGVVLSQVLVEDAEHGDVILHGIFNYTDSDSNITTREFGDPFSYDRIVAGFQVEWRF